MHVAWWLVHPLVLASPHLEVILHGVLADRLEVLLPLRPPSWVGSVNMTIRRERRVLLSSVLSSPRSEGKQFLLM